MFLHVLLSPSNALISHRQTQSQLNQSDLTNKQLESSLNMQRKLSENLQSELENTRVYLFIIIQFTVIGN